MEETLACNICGAKVDAAQLGAHLSEPSHLSKKKELDAKLHDVESQPYSNESVASLWEATIADR